MNLEETRRNDIAVTTASSPRMDSREWWLWGFSVAVTLFLTFAIFAVAYPRIDSVTTDKINYFNLKEWVRGLVALVLLFDLYTVYQHFQIQRMRRQIAGRERLFRLITENAADMITVIDAHGRQVYNSPAYQRLLGYDHEELRQTSLFEQIHPDDCARVTCALEKARQTGRGEKLEYRMRRRDGSWPIFESTANVIRDAEGDFGGLVVVNRDITDRKHAEELLAHTAFYDGLTNLPNRALLLDRVGRSLAASRRHADFKFGILCIDIDGFRIVNDSLGYAAGDSLLILIGQRLTSCLRRSDTVCRPGMEAANRLELGDSTLARPGGNEFVALVEELRTPADAIRIAERIHRKLEEPFRVTGHEIVVTASIGILFSSDNNSEPEGVLRNSEIALYRAKGAGKARSEVFDQAMHSAAMKRLQLEADLRKGVEREEFLVYYQTIVSLPDRHIVGFEALTRWSRPQGIVMPAEFIPLADETGIILSINRALLPIASRQLKQWQEDCPSNPPLFLSVNVSSKQFAQVDLASQIRLLLQESGMDARCIALEITETIAMADPERSAAVLADLRAIGVRIDIDDFGTGYSSLSRLQQFRVDRLKIDRTFVSRIDTDRETHEIVRTIIMLAHSLGLEVIAEGVENEDQLDLLLKMGCERAQGYLFSKPVNAETVSQILSDRNPRARTNLRAGVSDLKRGDLRLETN